MNFISAASGSRRTIETALSNAWRELRGGIGDLSKYFLTKPEWVL